MLKRILITLTLNLTLFIPGISQYNITKFNAVVNENCGFITYDSNGDFVSILYKNNNETNFYDSFLYKLNNDGDTLFSKKFHKADTVLFLENIISCKSNPVEYLLHATCYKSNEDWRKTSQVFYRIDSEFNIIWEKIYNLRPEECYWPYGSIYPQLLQKKDSGFIMATNIDGIENLVFFEISQFGDSLKYRHYTADSAGKMLLNLTYNHDSSAYYAFTSYAHDYQGNIQVITIDTNLNQTDVNSLADNFRFLSSSKLLPGGNIISAGNYTSLLELSICALGIAKYDINKDITDSCLIGVDGIDIRKDGGFMSLDYYYPNSIYFAGTYDYDVGIWVQHPSWILIGLVDSSMNLVSEKYIGGDAYYRFNTLTATNDGGILVGALRYDYLTQDYEHDAYFFRFDSLEMTVSVGENKSPLVKNAIVYPNPAKDRFYLRTSQTNSRILIYDLSGNMVFSQQIENNITKIQSNKITPGVYVWKLIKESLQIETGKVLITK